MPCKLMKLMKHCHVKSMWLSHIETYFSFWVKLNMTQPGCAGAHWAANQKSNF